MEAEAGLAAKLLALDRLAPVLAAVRAATAPEEGVYLVGGAVRDLLLGRPEFDLDLVVEGDAIAFARRLAEALDGSVLPHETFGTAVVDYGDGARLDVAGTRTETYAEPAALPVVAPGRLEDDLRRRDFTINAMAVSLGEGDFGRLVDPFAGRDDLETGTIRVLHDRSFTDDPTRILRAARYESRLGFMMDGATERLARETAGQLDRLSGERLRSELVLLLDEEQAPRSIARLGELGALRVAPKAADLFERTRALAARYAPEVPAWRLGLAVLAPPNPNEWLDRLRVPRRDADRIADAVTQTPRLAEHLAGPEPTAADLVELLEPHPPETLLLALAQSELPAIRRYFDELGGIRLAIDGRDLAELGLPESPRVGEILGELRRRKLNGELDGRESELAAARELIAG